MRAQYQQADRQTKSALLDQMVTVTGLHHKRMLQQLGEDLQRHPRAMERGAVYGPEVRAALAVIAESLDYVCAERLHPQLLPTVEYLAAHGELRLTSTLRQLAQISLFTMHRLASGPAVNPAGIVRPYPRLGNVLQRQIPAKRLPWDPLDARLLHGKILRYPHFLRDTCYDQ